MADLLYQYEFENYIYEVYNDKPSFEVFEVKQTHSAIVVEDSQTNANTEADGIIGLNLTTPLAIKTADCLPIIIIGKDKACIVHAGWKGLQRRIIEDEKINKLGPKQAHIGPHISQKNYEVGTEFINEFPSSQAFKSINSKQCFGLAQEAKNQILSSYAITASDSEICTFENLDYNSYRRNKTTKRNWNILKRK